MQTISSWSRAVSYSTIVALIFSLTLGLGGYLIFNEHIEGDILNNFESSGVAVSAGKTLLALCMILTYPVECFIARHCVNSLIDYYRSRPYDNLDCRNNSSNISESDMDDHIFCQVMQNITSPNNDYDANLEDEIVEIQLGMKQFCEDKVSNRAQIDNYDDGATASNADHSLLRPNVWHVIITLLLWISSTLLSLVFTDLQIVLSFTGMDLIISVCHCFFK